MTTQQEASLVTEKLKAFTEGAVTEFQNNNPSAFGASATGYAVTKAIKSANEAGRNFVRGLFGVK
ncbi:MAG: hypothetical protein RBT37_09640 [Dissulfurispiraceae bacterium]|jgi:hypothetical protein|nr:hypothetical protein [Dissulfurispiraceae bacterium]